jgi:hypothetical protein
MGSRERASARAGLALAVLAVVAGCSTAGASPQASQPDATGNPVQAFTAPVSFSGPLAWRAAGNGLALSPDSGRNWLSVPLPAGVTQSSIGAVSWAPNGLLWLAVPGQSGDVLLYRTAISSSGVAASSAVATWSRVSLTPTGPALADVVGLPPTVVIAGGPAEFVAVTVSYAWSPSSAATWLFTSEDDGVTFVEHPSPLAGGISTTWNSLVFADWKSGVVVAGMASAKLYHTSDGGSSWSEVVTPGLPGPTSRSFGSPILSGAQLLLPVTLFTDEGKASLQLLVSHDGGATFDTSGATVALGASSSAAADSVGGVSWAITNAGDILYVSSDAGRSWASVRTKGLPAGVVSLGLVNPMKATAEVQEGGCTGKKTACWSDWLLYATTDGGKTWVEV